MSKQYGSQIQFSPKEEGVEVIGIYKKMLFTIDPGAGRVQLWSYNQHYAGAVLRYKNKNYEFVRSFR